MTKLEAIATLKSNPTASVSYSTRDATGQWFENHLVWLDTDGDLVQAHPTEDRGTCAAPEGVEYRAE